MSWKNTQQASLADTLVIEHKSLSELDDVHNIIFWPEIEHTLSGLYSSVRGAPAYPPLMMFKILILQAWYNCSGLTNCSGPLILDTFQATFSNSAIF